MYDRFSSQVLQLAAARFKPTSLRVRPGQQLLRAERALFIGSAHRRGHTRFQRRFSQRTPAKQQKAQIMKLQREHFFARTPSHTKLIFPGSNNTSESS